VIVCTAQVIELRQAAGRRHILDDCVASRVARCAKRSLAAVNYFNLLVHLTKEPGGDSLKAIITIDGSANPVVRVNAGTVMPGIFCVIIA
jgi:hypothetical protein